MKELKDLPILPASKLVNYNPLNFWFLNYNKYYFLNSSSMYLKDVGSIKELFIVPDEKENIKAIFIFIVKPCSNLKSLLNNTFDMPAVEANSGMLNQQRSQTLWNKNGISVFLTDGDNHKYTKISILLQGDENTPGVNIE